MTYRSAMFCLSGRRKIIKRQISCHQITASRRPTEKSDLWPGSWKWVVYTANTAKEVKHYAGLGIELIETDRYSELKQESDIVDVSNDF